MPLPTDNEAKLNVASVIPCEDPGRNEKKPLKPSGNPEHVPFLPLWAKTVG